jgi:hypothetical protein
VIEFYREKVDEHRLVLLQQLKEEKNQKMIDKMEKEVIYSEIKCLSFDRMILYFNFS